MHLKKPNGIPCEFRRSAMKKSRIKNTTRNIAFSFVDSIVSLLFQFASRTIIIHVLGTEYLGLSSLFSSVLQILNMTEMGFSIAIIYNMYKPIAENDEQKICSLLNYYRKIYRYVAIIIAALGLTIMPFIPKLINGTYPIEININLLYVLYLINSVVSYSAFAYKTALLTALQRLDLVKVAHTIACILQYSLQIITLLLLKNYYLFIIVMILGTAARNIIAAYNAKKNFPNYICSGTIDKLTKSEIFKQVKGLLICNVSAITYTTFDSIILSSLIGLNAVAIYNNYIIVFNGVMSFITMIRSAMQASVGDSIATEKKEKNLRDLSLWQFLFSIIAIICCSCMISLYQPFMLIWMGSEMLLPIIDIILICIWFYMNTVQHSYFLYMSGSGLWTEMKWPYILSTVCNLLLNILLGRALGTTGIILATVIATFIFGMIWQCIIVFKKYFGISAFHYLIQQLIYFFITVLVCIISYLLCSLVSIDGIIGLIAKGIICVINSIILVCIFFRNKSVFNDARILVRKMLLHRH